MCLHVALLCLHLTLLCLHVALVCLHVALLCLHAALLCLHVAPLCIAAAKQSQVAEPSASGADSTAEELDMEPRSKRVGSMSGASTVSSSVCEPQGEVVNQKALNIVKRVKDKLTGRDFPITDKEVNVERQVELLIEQAMSHANLCQCYIGWCPFW